MADKDNNKNVNDDEEWDNEEQDDNTTSGGGNNSNDNKNDGNKGGKDTSNKKESRSFSQDQVSRMMTREKNQGRAAAYKEIGIDPNDTKTLKMIQAFIASQKSDEQKSAEQDIEAKNKQAEMEHKLAVAEAKAEAMMIGVKPQYVEDAVTMALPKVSSDTDLKTVLNELKDKYSVWFEADENGDGAGNNNQKKTGQRGTGTSVSDNGKKNNKESVGMGARLAAQRKVSSGKSSYWGANR